MPQTIIQIVREISDSLTQSTAQTRNLAEKLGTIYEKIFDQLQVTPKFEGITAITVMPQATSDEPSHIRIRLAKAITLNELVTAFGNYDESPPMANEPAHAIFEFKTTSTTHRATLMAPLDSDSATTLTLRRDMIP